MRLPTSCAVATAIALSLLCSAPGITSPLSRNTFPLEQDPTEMSPARFKIYSQLHAVLPDFDFDAQCEIQSFRLVRVSRRADPVMVENRGSTFNTSTRALVNKAQFGDNYYFEDIKTRCHGDQHARPTPSIVIKIR